MNKIFKTIFDKKTSRLVVTSELAKNSGGLKSESNVVSSLDRRNSKSSSVVLKITGILGLCIASIPAYAIQTPEGMGECYPLGSPTFYPTGADGVSGLNGNNFVTQGFGVSDSNKLPPCATGQIVTGSHNEISSISEINNNSNNAIIGGRNNKIEKTQRISTGNNFIGGGDSNTITNGVGSSIIGGNDNKVTGTAAITIGGMDTNNNGGTIIGAISSKVTEPTGMVIGGIHGVSNNVYALSLNGGKALGENSMAFGSNVTAKGKNSVAIGVGVNGNQSGSQANGEASFALNGAEATGDFSIAAGDSSVALGEHSVAIGNGAIANASKAYAFGNGAMADSEDSYGIGGHAQVDGSIALGKGSLANVDKGQEGYNPSKSMAEQFSPKTEPIAVKQTLVATNTTQPTAQEATWKSTAAAVSIGDINKGITRQITSLAAGTKDTDAVNVAQLQSLKTWTQDGLKKANEKIASNKIAIEQNENSIKTNADNIQRNKDLIDNIKGQVANVDKNSREIDVHKALIDDNAKKIKANQQETEDNTRRTTENRQLIGGVEGKVDKMKSTVAQNKNRIDHIEVDTHTNAKNIETNTQNIAKIAKVHADVSGVISKVATNTAAINQVVGRVSSNTKAIEANTNAIEANKSRINHLDKREQRHMAQLSALSGLFQPYEIGQFYVTGAVGQYRSHTGIALGTGYRFNRNVAVKVGAAMTTQNQDDATYNAGVYIGF